MRKIIILACLSILLYSHIADAESIVLYDGSLNGGTETPSNQGWLYVADPVLGSFASQNATGGVTTLNTMAYGNIMAGYFNQDPTGTTGYIHPSLTNVSLDRYSGFSLNFSAQLNSESHSYNDRAGFSVIVITSDLMGIELGFWSNEIWAQSDNPLFTHAEGVSMITNSMNDYTLQILNDTYSLYLDDILKLTGNLKNYSSWVNPLDGGHKPYDIQNFLFFGDDTSSAKASVSISKIEVEINSVPEPSSILLFVAGIYSLIIKRKKTN